MKQTYQVLVLLLYDGATFDSSANVKKQHLQNAMNDAIGLDRRFKIRLRSLPRSRHCEDLFLRWMSALEIWQQLHRAHPPDGELRDSLHRSTRAVAPPQVERRACGRRYVSPGMKSAGALLTRVERIAQPYLNRERNHPTNLRQWFAKELVWTGGSAARSPV